MPIGDICVRDTITCNRDTKIHQVLQLMRQHHVGSVVVTEDHNGKQVPVGIITDRDIVTSVVAVRLDPTIFSVGDLVIRQIVTVQEDCAVFEAIQEMCKHGVRRLPVVNQEGTLAGIVAVDDLIGFLAGEMSALSKLIVKEQADETRRKPNYDTSRSA
jgi:predicted transcriptional regulator